MPNRMANPNKLAYPGQKVICKINGDCNSLHVGSTYTVELVVLSGIDHKGRAITSAGYVLKERVGERVYVWDTARFEVVG